MQISTGENHSFKEDGLRPVLSQGSCQTGEGQAGHGIKFPKFQSTVEKEVPRFAKMYFTILGKFLLPLRLSSLSKIEMCFLFRYEAAGDRNDLATSTKKELIATEAYRNANTISY